MPSTTVPASASDSINAVASVFEAEMSSEGKAPAAKPSAKKAPQADPEDDQDEIPEDDEGAESNAHAEGEEADEPEAQAADDDDENAEDEPEGEPEDDDENVEGQDEEDPVYRVRVAGQDIEVPLSELVNGYSRTSDYTRKTQELAQARQAFISEVQETRALRQQYLQNLTQVQALVQQANQPVDWEKLRAEDPIEFAAAWADNQRQQQALQQIEQQRMQIQQQEQQETLQEEERRLQYARQVLPQVIPEWKDPKVAKAERAALKEFGISHGYSANEMSAIDDPRIVVLLRKAYRYDQLKAKSQSLKPVKRTQTLNQTTSKPVLRPGSSAPKNVATRQASELTKAKQSLAKTKDVKGLTNYFEKLLTT